MKRYQIKFTGRVQRVGFRYSMTQLATTYSCTGWVRNLSDGSVLTEIQGDEISINKVLEEIQNIKYITIDDIEKYSIDIIEDEASFKVEYM